MPLYNELYHFRQQLYIGALNKASLIIRAHVCIRMRLQSLATFVLLYRLYTVLQLLNPACELMHGIYCMHSKGAAVHIASYTQAGQLTKCLQLCTSAKYVSSMQGNP